MPKNKIEIIRKIRYKVVYNRSGRLNKDGEGLLQIECRQGSKRIYFSAHTYVKPQNFINGLIVGTENDGGLNYAIYKMKNDIERIELEYIKKDVKVTLSLLKEAVQSNISPVARLIDFGNSVIKDSDRDKKTITNYKTLFNNLEKYKKGVFITDIDYNFVIGYDKFLRNSGIMHNTRISRLRQLRAILNEAVKRDIIDVNPFGRFKIQSMVSKHGYVTKEQLEELEKLELTGYEDIVRDSFLVGCYTGLRYSDIITLKDEHLRDGWIVKEMIKTKKIVEIPYTKLFSNKLQSIIDKYGYISALTKQICDNSGLNKLLRPILDSCDVDVKITFHSSRHTFATLLSQQGIQLTTVQKLLGHTKLATTQIYSESDRNTILNDICSCV